jgi:hypothetical protein
MPVTVRIIRRIPSMLDTPRRLQSSRYACHSSSSILPALRLGVSCSLGPAGRATARAQPLPPDGSCSSRTGSWHPPTQPAAGSAPPSRLLVGLAGITPAAANWCGNCGQARCSCPAAAWGADRRVAVTAPRGGEGRPLKLARCWHKPSPLDCAGLRCLTPRTFADLRGLQRLALAYARLRPPERTANAVWVYAHPGFIPEPPLLAG